MANDVPTEDREFPREPARQLRLTRFERLDVVEEGPQVVRNRLIERVARSVDGGKVSLTTTTSSLSTCSFNSG